MVKMLERRGPLDVLEMAAQPEINFVGNLRLIMKAEKLKASTLAYRLGVPRTSLWNWLDGRTRCRDITIVNWVNLWAEKYRNTP